MGSEMCIRDRSWRACFFFFVSSQERQHPGSDVPDGHKNEDDEAPPEPPVPMTRRVLPLFSPRSTPKTDATISGSIETAPVPPSRSPSWRVLFSFSHRRREATSGKVRMFPADTIARPTMSKA